MSNKWFKQLMDSEGAVDKTLDPYREENMVRSSSPSLNWVFANKGFGVPRNASIVAYGQAKAGKSLISNMFIQNELHRDPEAMAITFNTEIRGQLQTGSLFGIDHTRHISYDVNAPAEIFDKIEKEIIPMVEQGMPLRVLVIDSLNGIRGTKSLNTDSVDSHLMGDEALTIKNGLKRIIPLLKKHSVLFISTAHVTANIGAVGMHAPKTKAGLSNYARHSYEYYLSVSRDNSAEGKSDVLGDKFEVDIKDFKGKKQINGHRIFVKMDENSLGVSGRTGEFTIDYKKGVINAEDEIAELAIMTSSVERPNNRTYIVNGNTYTSKKDFIIAVRENKEVQEALISKIIEKDL
jgi:GTPase SAR1 family protein